MKLLKVGQRPWLVAIVLVAFPHPKEAVRSAAPPKPAHLDGGAAADQVLPVARGGLNRGCREQSEDQARRAGSLEELRQRAEDLERERAGIHEKAQRVAHKFEEAIRATEEDREKNALLLEQLKTTLTERLQELAENDELDNEERETLREKHYQEWQNALRAQGDLARKAESLTADLNEHFADVDHRVAELERELAVVKGTLAAKIARRVRELDREIGEMRRSGKHDVAETLRAEMRDLRLHLAGPGGRERQRREGRNGLEEMERDLRNLRETGRHDEAERLERELHELDQRLNAPQGGGRPHPLPDLKTTIHHLQAAVEDLHAAGLHEQAERIKRIMNEVTLSEPQQREPHVRANSAGPDGRTQPGGKSVVQLRDEMEHLRRENAELRAKLQELREPPK